MLRATLLALALLAAGHALGGLAPAGAASAQDPSDLPVHSGSLQADVPCVAFSLQPPHVALTECRILP